VSLVTMLADVAGELGLQPISSVIGSLDVSTRQLRALANRSIRDIRRRSTWPQLMKTHTITLVNGQAAYPFPADYDRQVFRTHWNQNRKWELLGPISEQEYQLRLNGIISTSPRQRYSIRGWANNRFTISPTPSGSDGGQIIVFSYQSVNSIVPVSWTESAVFMAGAYCSYDGNIYTTLLGGVTGATPPTHTSGSVNDGGVEWEYYPGRYEFYQADTDECLIDENVVGLSVQWRFAQMKGLQYQKTEEEFEKALKREIVAARGAKTLSLTRNRARFLLNAWNAPDTGYGS
jgi:hypothetical protein